MPRKNMTLSEISIEIVRRKKERAKDKYIRKCEYSKKLKTK